MDQRRAMLEAESSSSELDISDNTVSSDSDSDSDDSSDFEYYLGGPRRPASITKLLVSRRLMYTSSQGHRLARFTLSSTQISQKQRSRSRDRYNSLLYHCDSDSGSRSKPSRLAGFPTATGTLRLRLHISDQAAKQAGQIYELKSKKNPRDAADEHTRYINLLSALGPEVNREKSPSCPPSPCIHSLHFAHQQPCPSRHSEAYVYPVQSRCELLTRRRCRVDARVRNFSPTPGPTTHVDHEAIDGATRLLTGTSTV